MEIRRCLLLFVFICVALKCAVECTFAKDTSTDSGKLCDIFIFLNGVCADRSQCTLVDGHPSCVPTQSKATITLVVIVVTCMIGVLGVATAIVCVSVRVYKARRKRRHPKKMTGVKYRFQTDLMTWITDGYNVL